MQLLAAFHDTINTWSIVNMLSIELHWLITDIVFDLGNRQWAEALALYQRSETYINGAQGKVLKDADFIKFAYLSQDLPVLLDLVSSGQ